VARDEARGAKVEVLCHDEPIEAIAERAAECDLMILGLEKRGRRGRVVGQFVLDLARKTDRPLILIGHRA